MAKISEFTEVTAPAASDVIPVVSGGVTKKLKLNNIPVAESQVTGLVTDLAALATATPTPAQVATRAFLGM